MGHRTKSVKPVLVVEDSPLLERMIIESLEKAGYVNVMCCHNGREAWDTLMKLKESGDPISDHASIVITDIEMPQMDGHRLLRLIREDPILRKLPVIIFSSLITNEMRAKGDELGATAQITKQEITNLVKTIDENIL